MSIKDLFEGLNNKVLSSKNLNDLTRDVESEEYVEAYELRADKFQPPVNFSRPGNFARFGSAEKYFENSIKHIYNNYPYDGSLKEKLLWHVSASHLDNYIFEYEYPRTNGYALFSADGWGDFDTGYTSGSIAKYYGATATASYEYIKFTGNPHPAVSEEEIRGREATTITTAKSFPDAGGNANLYKQSDHRGLNLEIDPVNHGVTVEFWLKKDSFDTDNTTKEVVLDVWNGKASSSADYGRLMIELSGTTTSESPWRISLQSGSQGAGGSGAGFFNYQIGSSIAGTGSLSTWTHYAFNFLSASSGIETKFYVDGALNQEVTVGSAGLGVITGSMVGHIGALQTAPGDDAFDGISSMTGWGKLSGSMDEFRYWKVKRNSEQIGRYWFDQVGAGVNTDTANTGLGVYYKFNEGITGTGSIDDQVLDYSGRISNGAWVGYDTYSRATDSAIVLAGAATKEFKDPIIYPDHPDVVAYKDKKELLGQEHDYSNNASIYFNTYPDWIVDDDCDTNLLNLTQIISSYLDELYIQINHYTKLKSKNYLIDGPSSTSFKPIPFADKLLTSMGLVTPELFSEIDNLERYETRNDEKLFSDELYNLKNTIYTNIYNNLSEIYKSKGTVDSFRNLFRCFGIDEELIKLNLYASDETFILRDNYKPISRGNRVIDFNSPGRFESVVTHQSSSLTFVSASYSENLEAGLAMTVECDIVFPKKISEEDPGFFPTTFQSSSLFGCHTATGSASDYDFPAAANDVSNFQVFAVRRADESDDVKFQLTGTVGGFVGEESLETSIYADVYNNEKWTLAVRVYPATYPQSGIVLNDGTYKVDFYGVNVRTDLVLNEFELTGTLTEAQANSFFNNPKRFFVGAHKTHATGSVINKSDVKVSACRVWMDYVENDVVKQHAIVTTNYGADSPYKSAFTFATNLTGSRIPKIDTLALNWDFSTVTGSNASGEFIVEDFSSGSGDSRYDWFTDVAKAEHKARGYDFPASDTDFARFDYTFAYRKQLPEIIDSDSTINILDNDDITFTREHRPINHFYSFEKSMYQEISGDMIDMFSTVKDFNHLIGQPVNRYRQNYKHMEKLRELFFERVSNTPDIEKFVDFYKWIDDAVSIILLQLIPASANTSDRIRTMIESHVLERNKYWSKFPTLEVKQSDPLANAAGINELLYNWKFGHPPISNNENENCLWWEDRTERSNSAITSGDSDVDTQRERIRVRANTQVSGSTYAVRKLSRPYRFLTTEVEQLGGGVNSPANKKSEALSAILQPNTSTTVDISLRSVKDCIDEENAEEATRFNKKIKIPLDATGLVGDDVINGAKIAPFTVFSSSAGNTTLEVASNKEVTNLHVDGYGALKEKPLQGPFTEKNVGGLQYRHVNMATGSDTEANRPEGFRLKIDSSSETVSISQPEKNSAGSVNLELPRARYYRDELAKRPVNVRNIQQTTASFVLGNYDQLVDVVQTSNRTTNNRWWVENYNSETTTPISASEGNSFLVGDASSAGSVSQSAEYTKAVRGRTPHVIVERFSAPGGPETMGDSAGGPGLDAIAAEYSIHNMLNYRNSLVRGALDSFLTEHVGQFGIDPSGAIGDGTTPAEHTVNELSYDGPIAAYHKTNRNTIKQRRYAEGYDEATDPGDGSAFTTASVRDNYFIQHAIPQSDLQYAWITASAISAPFGYATDQRRDIAGAQTITFASSSDFGSTTNATPWDTFMGWKWGFPQSGIPSGHKFLPASVIGLNWPIVEPISSSSNILGYPSGVPLIAPLASGHTVADRGQYLADADLGGIGHNAVASLHDAGAFPPVDYGWPLAQNLFPDTMAHLFNALMLKRNSLYGYPSWRQIRTGEHPVAFNQRRKLNQYQFIENASDRSRGTFTSFTEAPVSSKYYPIQHQLSLDETDAVIKLTHTYANNITYFADNTVVNKLNLRNNSRQAYDELVDIYLRSDLEGPTNPINSFVSLKYKEVVYPKPQYAYLDKTRSKINFDALGEIGWNSNSYTRRVGVTKRGEVSHEDGFVLDTVNFPTNSQGQADPPFRQSRWPLDGRAGDVLGAGALGANLATASFESSQVLTISASLASLPAGNNTSASHGRHAEGELLSDYSQFHNGTFSRLAPAALYARRDIGYSADGIYVVGDAKWEAASQSGLNPFHDTYDDYSDIIKRVGKDYTVLPEFRISDHIEYFVDEQGGNFLADIQDNAFLKLDGASLTSSAEAGFFKEYSHTDFMRYFDVIAGDHEGTDIGSAKTITLRCKALKKFRPREGFYPAQRALQLATLFSKSYGPVTKLTSSIDSSATGEASWRTMLQPFYAPGILFNTIKSGIAVDYPLITAASRTVDTVATNPRRLNRYVTASATRFSDLDFADHNVDSITVLSGNFGKRLPFEAIIDPMSYLDKVQIIDNEPHPSASIQSSASFEGSPGLSHKLGINNFLAETISFYLQDQRLSFFASRDDASDTFGQVQKQNSIVKEYIMDVFLKEGMGTPVEAGDVTLREGLTNNSVEATQESSLNMYTRPEAFGPPMFAGKILGTANDRETFGSAPFTPPYYDGFARARLTFKPTEAKKFSAQEIVSNITIEYSASALVNAARVNNEDNHNYNNAMQLSASINLDGLIKGKKAVFDDQGNITGFEDDPNFGDRWVLQTKMETPVLDFTHVSASVPVSGSRRLTTAGGSVPIGMWHQYGRIAPNSDQGIFFEVVDVADSDKNDAKLTGSLIDLVGFERASKPIGQVARALEVREAVVAVPFIYKDGQKTRFSINRNRLQSVLNGDPQPGRDGPIIDLVDKMQQYVFPPQMDFITNDSVDPFAMYIFEFKYSFSQQDLVDMWQNLAPSRIFRDEGFEASEASIQHDLFADSFLGQAPKRRDIRWEVFKVKQKADTDYSQKVVSRNAPLSSLINRKSLLGRVSKDKNVLDSNIIDQGETLDYGFNWPYDYFSIVELVKLEAEMLFEADGPSRRSLGPTTNVDTETRVIDSQQREDRQLRVTNRLRGPGRLDDI